MYICFLNYDEVVVLLYKYSKCWFVESNLLWKKLNKNVVRFFSSKEIWKKWKDIDGKVVFGYCCRVLDVGYNKIILMNIFK